MSEKKAIFVSDVHLSDPKAPQWSSFLGFLKGLTKDKLTDLFLVGDIFDLWVADHNYFKIQYKIFIDELLRLKKSGIEIHFFEGNHDLYLKSFWQDQLGFKVYQGPTYFEINDLNVRVEHGDEMDPSDRGYIFLRAFLRMPFVKWFNIKMPEKLITKIGEKASAKSRAYTSKVKIINNEQAIDLIRVHAENAFMEMPFDVIVSGHVHVSDEYEFDVAGLKGKSFNLGSWFNDPKYLILKGNTPTLMSVD